MKVLARLNAMKSADAADWYMQNVIIPALHKYRLEFSGDPLRVEVPVGGQGQEEAIQINRVLDQAGLDQHLTPYDPLFPPAWYTTWREHGFQKRFESPISIYMPGGLMDQSYRYACGRVIWVAMHNWERAGCLAGGYDTDVDGKPAPFTVMEFLSGTTVEEAQAAMLLWAEETSTA